MATIVDSLIVELGLDPKGFTEGQRRVTQQLRQLEREAEQGANRVGQKTTSGLRNLFNALFGHTKAATSQAQSQAQQLGTVLTALNRGFQQINQQLTNTGGNARRQGQNIQAGAQTGAQGLQALAVAGVTAYTSLKAVQGLILSTQNIARDTMRTGQLATAANMPINQFSARALATSETTGAPRGQIESEIAQLQQDLDAAYLRGEFGERLTKMGMVGAPVDMKGGVEEVFRKVVEKVQGMPAHEALSWLTSMGFSMEHAQFLRQDPRRQQAAIEEAAGRAPTEEQKRNLGQLYSAIEKVINAYIALHREVISRFSAGGLAETLNGWGQLLTAANKNETAVKAYSVALGVGFVAALSTAILMIGRFYAMLLMISKNPGVAVLTGLARAMGPFVAAWAAWQAMGGGGNIPADEGGVKGANPEVGRNFWRGGRPARPGSGDTPNTQGPIKRWWNNVTRPWRSADGGAEADVPGDTEPNSFLAAQRARFKKELDEDPALKQQLAAVVQLENPKAGTGVVESLMNRMSIPTVNKSIRQGMFDRDSRGNTFYAPINKGLLPGTVAKLQANPELMAARMKNIDQALAGSNLIKGHTDQGSRGDPNYEAGGVGVNIHGERFNDWGVPGAREWRLRLQEGANKAAAPPPAAGDKPAGLADAPPGYIRQPNGFLRSTTTPPNTTPAGPGSYYVPSATPLAKYAQGSRHSMTAKQRYDADTLTGRRTEFPPGTKFNSRGEPYADTPQESLAGVAASMAAIRGGRGWKDTGQKPQIPPNYSTANTIGQVTIHTQATDAQGIARDMAGALDRTLNATDANQGLEY